MEQHSSALVVPNLPRAGLGNMLYVWARAVLFADLNNYSVVAPSWTPLRIGPYLRREKYKRFYGGFFSSKGYLPRFIYHLTKFQDAHTCHNPDVFASPPMVNSVGSHLIYIFDEVPLSTSLFSDMREYQPHVKNRLFSMVKPALSKRIESISPPKISIHVRLSDFRSPNPNENMTALFNLRTPIDWYVQTLIRVREVVGFDVPATIFSDGYDHELKELLHLPNVIRSPNASALIDMVTMSRGEFLIASAKSSFSAWASYLGQCPTVWHPTHSFPHYFPDSMKQSVFEGTLDPYQPIDRLPELLVENLTSTFTSKFSNYSTAIQKND